MKNEVVLKQNVFLYETFKPLWIDKLCLELYVDNCKSKGDQLKKSQLCCGDFATVYQKSMHLKLSLIEKKKKKKKKIIQSNPIS